MNKKITKLAVKAAVGLFIIAALTAGFVIWRTNGKVEIKFDIHMNSEAIYFSTYAEPPQFAIWLENPKSGDLKQVFVTYRAGRGDWEGKSDVPVAVPHWTTLFHDRNNEKVDGVSGATPKKESFVLQVEVSPGSEWVCWLEMNLAGDYNEYYPQFNRVTLQEDEFSCGQPALLYRADIKAERGNSYAPQLAYMSLWDNGENTLAPVDSTITTAQNVFDTITVSIVKPKPRIFKKNVKQQDILKE
ncbi:MAG: DUF2271 domain-containing protein [Prevotellaceae bacterium]|jgi:hypothetical protein|nr:DUF2271 domain-containing protein [Prevotellaceae bacterium]